MELVRDRELHEECGVFGVFGVPNAASLTYYGLHALQHRGQEGAGIVSADDGVFRRIKGDGGVRRGEARHAARRHGDRPCALYDGRRRRRREYPAVPVPPQYGRFRDGAQRQYRQFGPAAHLPRKQGQPVPVHLRQRDSGPPHQEGDPFPRPAAHPCDRRCAEHDRGRLRLPHHDGQPHLRLPRQVRPPAAVDRPAGRRLGRAPSTCWARSSCATSIPARS